MSLPMHTIVVKLIGPIEAVGETNADAARLTNLKTMIDLVDTLVRDIRTVAINRHHRESSVRESGRTAAEYLGDLHAFTEPYA